MSANELYDCIIVGGGPGGERGLLRSCRASRVIIDFRLEIFDGSSRISVIVSLYSRLP